MALSSFILAAFGLLSCDAFIVPVSPRAVSVAAAPTAAVAVAPRFAEPLMMAAKAPLKKKVVKKPVKKVVKKPVKKVVKKPVKKVVKKPVKKVVKKPIKKIIKKKPGKTSYAQLQRNSVGGGTDSATKLVQELVSTLLTPTQLAFVAGWALLAAKFLIFYERAP